MEGLAYIRNTPIHLVLALLIVPGYLTLAFPALRLPMITIAAGLSVVAYGVVNSVIGVGKMVSAVGLAATGRRWVNVPFVIVSYLLTGAAITLFGATTGYPVLLAGAFLFGLANISTNIANATISIANAPSWIIGRLMASRQVFIAGTTLIAMLAFGRLADTAGPQVALVLLGLVSMAGGSIVWAVAGRDLPVPRGGTAASAKADPPPRPKRKTAPRGRPQSAR